MSRENVEVVRAIYPGLRPAVPSGRIGVRGERRLPPVQRERREAFEEVGYEPQDFLTSGDYVVVPVKQSGRGKSSALGIEDDVANVWKLRWGKCVELRIFSTIEEARKATEPSA